MSDKRDYVNSYRDAARIISLLDSGINAQPLAPNEGVFLVTESNVLKPLRLHEGRLADAPMTWDVACPPFRKGDHILMVTHRWSAL